MKTMLHFSVRPRRGKITGLSSLNHSINVVRVHNSQAQGWGRRGPVSLPETCARILKLNLAFPGPELVDNGAHDGRAMVGLSTQLRGRGVK